MFKWPKPWPHGFFDLRDPATIVGDLGLGPAGAPSMANMVGNMNAGAPSPAGIAGAAPAGSPVSLPFYAPAAAPVEIDSITVGTPGTAEAVELKQSKCVARNPETDKKYRCILPDVEVRAKKSKAVTSWPGTIGINPDKKKAYKTEVSRL